MDQKFWDPLTRSHFLWHGGRPNQDDLGKLRQSNVKVIGISATHSFGAGKSTLIEYLSRQERFHHLVGVKTRPPRQLEKCGIVKFKSIDFKELSNLSVPAYCAANIGVQMCYPEWEYWGKKYNINVPSVEDVIKLIPKFISVYYLKDILQAVSESVGLDKVILIETHPGHEKDWLKIFPQMKVLRLDCNRELTINRIFNRDSVGYKETEDLNFDRVKALEAISTPTVSGDYEIVRVVNEYWDQIHGALQAVYELSGTEPKTVGRGFLRPNYLSSKILVYETMYQLLK